MGTRIHKYVDEEFGKGTYDKLKSGERTISINGKTFTTEEINTQKNISISDTAEVHINKRKMSITPPKISFDKSGFMKLTKAQAEPKLITKTKKVDAKYVDEPVLVFKTLEELVGKDKLVDVISGRAVLAINGEQLIVKSLEEAKKTYPENTKTLVIHAASGG